MTSYTFMVRELIQRTIDVIDQYQQNILGSVPTDDERDVTLLLNCLLGLLVYPQQLANRGQAIESEWLTNARVRDVGPEWGIKPEYIKNAGTKAICRNFATKKLHIEENDPSQLTMRKLLKLMRNCTAHAGFAAHDAGTGSGQIKAIIFEADPREDGFCMELPVEALETFVRALARSALNAIDQMTAHRSQKS